MDAKAASDTIFDIVSAVPVIPVLVVEEAASAADLARALVAGGLHVLEITLRTPAALEAIAAMAEVEGALVGAGTVLTAADARAAKQAGARFAVSPGSTPALLSACEEMGLPMLPGAATASEAMALLERGYGLQKFFPAEAVGGRKALKALASPLPAIRFCPTGGVSAENAPEYLALPNVVCVGGSWVAPPDAVAEGDWQRIERLAAEAKALRAA